MGVTISYHGQGVATRGFHAGRFCRGSAGPGPEFFYWTLGFPGPPLELEGSPGGPDLGS